MRVCSWGLEIINPHKIQQEMSTDPVSPGLLSSASSPSSHSQKSLRWSFVTLEGYLLLLDLGFPSFPSLSQHFAPALNFLSATHFLFFYFFSVETVKNAGSHFFPLMFGMPDVRSLHRPAPSVPTRLCSVRLVCVWEQPPFCPRRILGLYFSPPPLSPVLLSFYFHS